MLGPCSGGPSLSISVLVAWPLRLTESKLLPLLPSNMSMLALKRPRDDGYSPASSACGSSSQPAASTPVESSPMRSGMLVEDSPASKRVRSHSDAPGSAPRSAFLLSDPGAPPARISPADSAPKAAHDFLPPARKKTVFSPPFPVARSPRTGSAGSSSSQQPLPNLGEQLRQQPTDPQTGEVLFRLEQVRDIVRRAVDEKEQSLRYEYDRILQQKLQEQYQAFAKFNEDYISRNLKTHDLSYCS